MLGHIDVVDSENNVIKNPACPACADLDIWAKETNGDGTSTGKNLGPAGILPPNRYTRDRAFRTISLELGEPLDAS